MENKEPLYTKVIDPILEKYQWKILEPSTLNQLVSDLLIGTDEFCIRHYYLKFDGLVEVNDYDVIINSKLYNDAFHSTLTLIQFFFKVTPNFDYRVYIHGDPTSEYIGMVRFYNEKDSEHMMPTKFYAGFIDKNNPNQTVMHKLEIQH